MTDFEKTVLNNSPRILISSTDDLSWEVVRPAVCLAELRGHYRKFKQPDKFRPEVVAYHWDDRGKYYADYLYLHELYERLLIEISESLNKFHKTRRSLRYWRILVGPWLLYFTQILFDRWTTVQRAVNTYQISGATVAEFSPEHNIPNDMISFRSMCPTDEWNHSLYGRILTGWTNIQCERVIAGKEVAPNSIVGPETAVRPWIRRFKRWILECVSGISYRVQSPNNAFLISTFLPLWQEVALHILLRQLPALSLPLPAPKVIANPAVRREFSLASEGHIGFEHCIRTLLAEQIPTVYLEGYQELQKRVESLSWPKTPRVIFTACSYNSDDVFKAWAGLRVEEGTPLVIGQHGGNLGSALFSSTEDHEVAIADHYFTWGWADENPKHYPLGALKLFSRKSRSHNPDGKILLVSSVFPRYSYVMGSYPVGARQVEANLEDQYRFVRSLPKNIFEKLVVRTFQPDWGWSQVERWRDQFPDVCIDPGTEPIETLVNETRIYVATYNATTILEALGENIPTIAFWNPEHWELRKSAVPHFDRLKKVGILHTTPESASAKISEIWRDVEAWWDSAPVQETCREFCDRFAKVSANPVRDLRDALINVKAA